MDLIYVYDRKTGEFLRSVTESYAVFNTGAYTRKAIDFYTYPQDKYCYYYSENSEEWLYIKITDDSDEVATSSFNQLLIEMLVSLKKNKVDLESLTDEQILKLIKISLKSIRKTGNSDEDTDS